MLTTRIGTVLLTVPRHRYEPFKNMIFDNYSRSEAALIVAMAEMVINGVSTRKVSLVVEQLCGKSISKSSVSELCKDLDKSVKEFKDRPLECDYPFLIVDATYFKVRENHRVISKALMIALGISENGKREILGFELYDCENKDNWYDFLMRLQSRGLKGLKMITSDAHEGILHGIKRVFPQVPWQRCQFHFVKNIVEKAPKKYQAGLRIELNAMFQCSDIKEARKKRNAILQDYTDVAPNAMECLDNGFEAAVTVLCLPEPIRKLVRTTNHIERINRELKRRSNAIGVFPNGTSVVRLMGTVLLEHHEKLQGQKRLFFNPTYQEILAKTEFLKDIAREQKDLSSHLTIRQLSEELHASPTAIKSAFKNVYGVSVGEYRKSIRLQEAQRLLRETDRSIAEVAEMAGYSNPGHFAVAFRGKFAMTPGDYKRFVRSEG